ncbi:hypothetical protein CAC42_3998 [Sphaceloma murrayae]|uniref:FAD dependent oxidoreductase domain-containing protein n=1 Tax=Sphaceloma murrayae TaxID=2082308 RepID=A0A2K1QSS8_9PEZI|nr:hypothetical protein CAC42_3998 [Sphaceloma murrayae]
MAAAESGTPAGLPHPTPSSSFWHTEPSALLQGHRSTRELPKAVDVVVIGAGISGASVVHHLLEPYRQQDNNHTNGGAPSTLLLDAREVCWGATGRNGGHCQPLLFTHPNDPSIGHFELQGHAALARLSGVQLPTDPSPPPRKTFPCEFVTQPGVQAFYDHDTSIKTKSDLETLTGHDPELASHCSFITSKETLANLGVPDAVAALVTDTAGRCWPYKFVAGVIEDLVLDEGLHGRFNLQTWMPVVSISRRDEADQWSVKTARGSVQAKQVILATNGYTSAIMPDYTDMIVPCRGQMSAIKPPGELAGEKRLKTSWGFSEKGNHDYLIQRPNEFGGHLMYGGAEKYGHRLGVTDDSFVDDRQTKYLKTTLQRYFSLEEKKELDLVKTWSGIMGFSRDEVPLVGPVPGKKGLFMCAGFTGHGMPNTWLCGKTAASIANQIRRGVVSEDAVDAAAREMGLPRSYILTERRLEEARKRPTVYDGDHSCFAPYGGREL